MKFEKFLPSFVPDKEHYFRNDFYDKHSKTFLRRLLVTHNFLGCLQIGEN